MLCLVAFLLLVAVLCASVAHDSVLLMCSLVPDSTTAAIRRLPRFVQSRGVHSPCVGSALLFGTVGLIVPTIRLTVIGA